MAALILMITGPIENMGSSDSVGSGDTTALLRLLAWMSPAYPIGAYTYSQGLEHAVEVGQVTSMVTAQDWISDIIGHGTGQADASILAAAYRATIAEDRAELKRVTEFAAAFAPTSELHLESTAQGAAFLKITRDVWPCEALDWLVSGLEAPALSQAPALPQALALPAALALPVVIGVATAGHKIALVPACLAATHAFVANLVSAAVRLVPLGQTDGQRLIAALEPLVLQVASSAINTALDDIATSTVMVDISSMKHETQYTRLFRS